MKLAPCNYDDLIDSRDVIERIEELEADDERTEGETKELETLKKLAEEAEGYAADWQHGETLIRDSHFKEYAQQLAEDCGMMPEGNRWPLYCIDWEWAARELKHDYTSVDFGGVEYWIR